MSEEDREILRVFLASRGNMKELERHLGVSYPTVRARFDALLGRLGIERAPGAAEPPDAGLPEVEAPDAGLPEAEGPDADTSGGPQAGPQEPPAGERLALLEELARGGIDVDEALRRMG